MWMMAPTGTGFLCVEKEKIDRIWLLFPAAYPKGDDIRKLEHVGIQPEYLKLAAGDALDFHHGIGAKRKEERLRFLQNYWARALEKLPGVHLLTSYDPEQSCGIGTFIVENMDMGKLSTILFDRHQIYSINAGVPPIEESGENIPSMRVIPSIYTSLRELDIFIEAVTHYMKNGLPN